LLYIADGSVKVVNGTGELEANAVLERACSLHPFPLLLVGALAFRYSSAWEELCPLTPTHRLSIVIVFEVSSPCSSWVGCFPSCCCEEGGTSSLSRCFERFSIFSLVSPARSSGFENK
jgi:hypothetical protein